MPRTSPRRCGVRVRSALAASGRAARPSLPGVAHFDANLLARVDCHFKVRACMQHAVAGQLGGHDFGGFHGLESLIAEPIPDEQARCGHGLRLAAKLPRLGHDSIDRTPASPVSSMTRRTTGEGSRKCTAFTLSAAPSSTEIPALSM